MSETTLAAAKSVRRAHTEGAQFYEYSTAANPIRPGLTPPMPYHLFSPALYAEGPSRVVPLDLSAELKCEGPATGPGLCAHFVRLTTGEAVTLNPNATSQVFYVIGGAGSAVMGDMRLDWRAGDFFTLPGGAAAMLSATGNAALYMVNDAPLLTYLGVKVDRPRFAPTLYTAEQAELELAQAINAAAAKKRSRISVLLANENFPQTRTVTHVLWAMYGAVPAHSMQKPHRHQSIALDFIVRCEPGCYTLVGRELDSSGAIRSPTRVDWQPGCAFVTPPGHWHAHFNESGSEVRLIPIQDAGLQTYLRTLDIRFT